jgi:CheY-like chemotaxis protein
LPCVADLPKQPISIWVNTMSNDPILFVDDDLMSRLLSCAVLRDCGFNVLEARSYTEACRLIQEQPCLAALVTALDLASEGDGFELSRCARAANARILVVYLAGADVHRYVAEGVSESRFIPRPFDPYQIVRTLDDAAPLAPARLE